jgi:hypothetical protein
MRLKLDLKSGMRMVFDAATKPQKKKTEMSVISGRALVFVEGVDGIACGLLKMKDIYFNVN